MYNTVHVQYMLLLLC